MITFPNPAPATLRALLISVDPVVPLKGDLHTLEREVVLLGFNRRPDGRLEAITLVPAAAGELVVIVDTAGRSPTWSLLDQPAADGRWMLDKWRDVIDEAMRRHDVPTEPQPAGPTLGPVPGTDADVLLQTTRRSPTGPKARSPRHPREAL